MQFRFSDTASQFLAEATIEYGRDEAERLAGKIVGREIVEIDGRPCLVPVNLQASIERNRQVRLEGL